MDVLIRSEDIKKLIEDRQWRQIKNILADINAVDIVDIWETLSEEDILILFRLLKKEKAADVFTELEPDKQEALLKEMSNTQIKNMIMEIPPDDRTELFEELPGKATQKLLNILPYEERKEALGLLGYPEESVGRIMTPDYIAIQPEWDIEGALAHIREFGMDAETINVIYIVNKDWKLLDSIGLRRIILADPDTKIKDLMDEKFFAINAYEDQEEAAKIIQRYDLVAVPVVDALNTLLGIVTIDDVLDVLEEETTEDFHRVAAVSPLDISYSAASPWNLYAKRIFWLSILLVAGFLSSTVISHFRDTLSAVIALSFFIPILIDSGGNTATQSATLIIRAIAVGDLTIKKWFRVVKKELIIGLMLGTTLGVLLFFRTLIFKEGALIGLTLGLTTLSIIVMANILGAILPLILTKLKLDPAVISSPLLTTVIDTLGLIIYFSIANLIFGL